MRSVIKALSALMVIGSVSAMPADELAKQILKEVGEISARAIAEVEFANPSIVPLVLEEVKEMTRKAAAMAQRVDNKEKEASTEEKKDKDTDTQEENLRMFEQTEGPHGSQVLYFPANQSYVVITPGGARIHRPVITNKIDRFLEVLIGIVTPEPRLAFNPDRSIMASNLQRVEAAREFCPTHCVALGALTTPLSELGSIKDILGINSRHESATLNPSSDLPNAHIWIQIQKQNDRAVLTIMCYYPR